MSLQPQVEVWKELRPLIEEGTIETTEEADEVLSRLKRAYIDHRIKVKRGSIRFKGKVLETIPVPLKTTPYVHQVRAFGFGITVDCCALLMEQGTGKTLVAIAIAAQRFIDKQVKRIVIICPKSVIPVWPKELKKHLRMGWAYDRAPKEGRTELRFPTSKGIEFFIINYDKLDARYKEILKWKPDMLILDESHRVKNPTSGRSKACHKLAEKIQYKLILTGTVLGQSPVDAWSQYKVINPDVFGSSFKDFKDRFCVMSEPQINRQGGRLTEYTKIIGFKNLEEFAELLHSVAFRTTKEECLDLPEQVTQNAYCTPSPATLKVYNELNLEFSTIIEGEELDVDLVITKMIKLRQIVGGIVKHESGKLLKASQEKRGLLEEFLEDKDWESGKVVVAVSFTHEVEIVEEACKKLKLKSLTLTGATSDDDRDTIESRFEKSPQKTVLTIQVDTGGEGLDFTAANEMFIYSPTFSFIKISQIKARIHRIGQDEKVRYVFAIMEGTVDEQIVAFLEAHGDLTQLILETMRTYTLDKGEKMLGNTQLELALEKIKGEILEQRAKPKKKKLRRKLITQQEPKPKRRKLKRKKIVAKKKKVVRSVKATITAKDVQKPVKKAMPKKAKAPKDIMSKAKAAMAKKSVVKAPANRPAAKPGKNPYTADMMAEDLGQTAIEVRTLLRRLKIEKPGTRWVWNSKTAAKPIIAQLKASFKGIKRRPGKAEKKPPAKKSVAKPLAGTTPSKATKAAVKKKSAAKKSDGPASTASKPAKKPGKTSASKSTGAATAKPKKAPAKKKVKSKKK